MEATWIWLIPLLPAFGAIANGLLHSRALLARRTNPAAHVDEKTSGALGTAAIFAAFIVALMAFFKLAGLPEDARVLTATLGRWIDVGAISVSWTLSIDPLNAVLMLVITGVGTLIHLYSIGYMHGDTGFAKYFAYLNLFVAMMLVLVLSESILGLFLGWEGVGLCSYLLIGFWYQDGLKADAARKAFLVNRVGDLGFLIGAFLLFWGGAGTLSLAGINAAAPAMSPGLLTAAGLCLFIGCCGKSAQIPLHVWLPDAMAGPTPVSALIHAATMVTAGIYLIARLSPMFAIAPGVLEIVAVVGALTALFAATIAIAQRDIKKVLAYSTVSQLGYMFLALGVGAFSAGVFHLVTHAFFKALLFLGAGSVIHAMHERQDLFDMGGLKSRIPTTYKTFLIGSLALAGIPLFSGFFSKDEILFETAALGGGYWALWLIGSVAALLTAIYTARLVVLAFFGEPRFDENEVHVHESPLTMTLPLMILAALSVLGGLLGIPFVMHPLTEWLAPVTGAASEIARDHAHGSHGLEIALLIVGSAVALFGVWFGFNRYRQNVAAQRAAADSPTGVMVHPANAWYVDAFYAAFVVAPLKALAALSAAFDLIVIDGAVNGTARQARKLGGFVRRVQTGGAHDYALWFTLGSVVVLLAFYLGARS